MVRPAGNLTTWNHPVRNPKVIKAESDFEKLVYNERAELVTRDRRHNISDREVVATLALVKGITKTGMVAAALAPKTKKRYA